MNKYDVVDLLSYIATSAVGCINEPKIYGSFRLIDSVSRVMDVLKKNGLIEDIDFDKIIEKIDNNKYLCITDENGFVSMLNEVVNDLVELKLAEDEDSRSVK